MASRWGIKETETYFISGGSKITAGSDWNHEIKRRFLLGRKAMTNLDNVLRSRDIISMTKTCITNAMVFPIVLYEYERWTIKKAESWRTDAFELCVSVVPLCLTLWDPRGSSSPGFSVHGVFQARIQEWVAIPFSKWYSQPRDWTCVFCLGSWILYHCTTCETPNDRT